MSRDAQWYRRNDDYLAATLMLVRHRLNLVMPRPAPPPTDTEEKPPRPHGWLRSIVGGLDDGTEPTLALPPPADDAGAGVEEKRLCDALAEAATGDPPPAMVSLAATFGLSQFEQDLLALAVAAELDPHLSRQLSAGGRPTLALAMSVLPQPAWGSLAPGAPLRDWHLVNVERGQGEPLTSSPLVVDERILNHIKGLEHIDAALTALLRPVSPPTDDLPDSQRDTATAVMAALDPTRPEVAVLRGVDYAGIEEIAATAAAECGLSLFRLDSAALPADSAELDRLARLWHRETRLAPVALLIEASDAASGQGGESGLAPIARFVSRSGGGMVIAARDGIDLALTPLVDRAVSRPTVAEQLAAWQQALDKEDASADIARRMVRRFDFDRSGITAAVSTAHADGSDRPLADRLSDAARTRAATGVSRLAQRIEVKSTFDEIVLPPAQETQLRQIVAHLEHRHTVLEDWGFAARMNRGLGVSALFAGESGTGKTMAAEVIAHALGLDLYRIDLSAVVSKYIGETEKNLSRLFDAADSGGAVLLFDEADALFGRRSEVKESHDRFANIEIDYLLQRLESYRGVAILTSNMKSALDSAFMRRLRFVIDFPYPGPAERMRIWERAFPRHAPLADIDLKRLSWLDLNGAAIQSVALHSAFLAAGRGTPVTTDLALEAARGEIQKLGRPVNEGDFRAPSGMRSVR